MSVKDLWVRSYANGRRPKYESADDLWTACCKYFEWVEAHPLWEAKPFPFQGEVKIEKVPKLRAMTLAGLYLHLGICHRTWQTYRTKEYLSATCERAETVIRQQKFEGAAAELFSATIIARDLGLADKSRHELTGEEGGPIKTESKQLYVMGISPKKDADSDT